MDPNEPQHTLPPSGPVDPDGQNSTRLTSGQGLPNSVAKPYISDNKLKPGDVVGDNYVIIELLGVGGMGYVYKVRHLILEKVYAMKTISGEQVSEIAWRRLQVEAQAIARINHPNIVGIHNLGIHQENHQGTGQGIEQRKIPYYVMDYLKGKNLAEILKRTKSLSLEESLPLFIEICSGLGFAHKKGIVHRDIKPGNIVILDEPDFSGARVKIVDFGIAKLAGTIDPDNQKLTTIGEVFGSPLYMSPEQCEGNRIDSRSDIYSLGCTFFETLTGDVPFHGENQVATMLMHSQAEPRTLFEASGLDFPESIEHLVATMLAKAPMNRYPNLERVGDDLQRILAGDEISMSPFNTSINLNRFADQFESTDQNDDEGEETVLVKSTRVKLKTFAIAGSLLLLGAISIALYSVYFKTKAIPVPVSTAVSRPTDPAEHYYSTAPDGGTTIVFNFPQEQSLGKIGYGETGKHEEARGRVTLDRTRKIYFLANDYLCTHPELVDRFRPDDLWAFLTPQVMDKTTDVTLIMPHITKLTGLGKLNIENSNVNNDMIADIEKLPNLVSLNLDMTRITGAGLAKYSRLKKLNQLFFSYNKGTTDILKAIAGSSELQNFYLELPEAPLTIEQAKLIAECKNLRHIDLQASGLNDEGLYILSALPRVRTIDASSCKISKQAIKKIRSERHGKPIRISTSVAYQDKNAFGNESPEDWLKE